MAVSSLSEVLDLWDDTFWAMSVRLLSVPYFVTFQEKTTSTVSIVASLGDHRFGVKGNFPFSLERGCTTSPDSKP
jgi:hypothetical protein